MSRYPRKSVAQIGMLIFSAATIVTVFAAGFTDMLTYRALTGIGEAMQLTGLAGDRVQLLRALSRLRHRCAQLRVRYRRRARPARGRRDVVRLRIMARTR